VTFFHPVSIEEIKLKFNSDHPVTARKPA
jgi:hypothetical protein